MTEQQVTERARMLHALRAFIVQRPGLDPRDYGCGAEDWKAYRRQCAEITRDREDALTLWRYVAHVAGGMGPGYLAASGRLTWDSARGEWDYVTGQYFPTEYRRAASRVLAVALWNYWRDGMGPDATADAIRRTANLSFRSRRVRRFFQ